MKTARKIMQGLAWTIIAMLVILLGFGTSTRQAWAQEDDYRFSKEELVQMLAPIALYPDSLIAQMLIASTYPLEVVEAERWLSGNRDLVGDALYDALREKPWDPSIKALCHFPDLLFAMSENLDQTRKLGDAFLAQEQEVMDTIQELRSKAMEQGNLETTEEQKVIVEREIIRIEPASPGVVYVPVYDPYYVYGPWWYPAYPPYYWYYPLRPFVSGISIGFGPGIFIGIDLFSWVWFDWYVHRIYVDAPRTYRFHRYPVRPMADRYYWRHDPRHRRGVAYRDRRTSEHFGASPPRLRSPRPETRGYPAGTMERSAPAPATAPSQGRERTIAPETRPEPRRIQPAPLRETPPPTPGQVRERTIAPETRSEPRRIQPAPLRETPPPTPGQVRERTIAPETRPEPRRIQPAPLRETPPPVPSQVRERTIAPETRPEPRRIQPAPRRETPPPAPAQVRERIPAPAKGVETEKIQPSPGRDTPFRGINEGSFERRARERGEESRRGGETREQNIDSRGEGSGPRRK